MYYRIMTNGNVISNCCARSFKCTVNTGSILDIYLIADANKIYIATNNCIKPDTSVITHDHVTHDSGVGSDETIFSKLWIFVFNWKYNRHWG